MPVDQIPTKRGFGLSTKSYLFADDEWSPMFSKYYLYYLSRRQNSPAFKVIVDALKV